MASPHRLLNQITIIFSASDLSDQFRQISPCVILAGGRRSAQLGGGQRNEVSGWGSVRHLARVFHVASISPTPSALPTSLPARYNKQDEVRELMFNQKPSAVLRRSDSCKIGLFMTCSPELVVLRIYSGSNTTGWSLKVCSETDGVVWT